MLSDDLKKSVYQGIPNDFNGIDPNLSSISKLYENQWYNIDDDKMKYPMITLDYASVVNEVNVPLNKIRDVTKEPTDTVTYETGTFLYTLEYDNITDITKVEGVVSGRKHVFDAVEYQIDGGATQIKFLGPTYPDDGKYVRVTYKVKWHIALYGGEYQDKLIINVRTRDHRIETRTINGLKLAHAIINDIYAWVQFTADIEGILFVNPSDVKDLSSLEATNMLYRLQFDIEVRYVYHREVKIQNIEDVQPTIVVGT